MNFKKIVVFEADPAFNRIIADYANQANGIELTESRTYNGNTVKGWVVAHENDLHSIVGKALTENVIFRVYHTDDTSSTAELTKIPLKNIKVWHREFGKDQDSGSRNEKERIKKARNFAGKAKKMKAK